MNDELVDRITPEGRLIGPVSKHAAHQHGWLHRTVLAHVRTAGGDIVLVRQTPDRQDAGQLVCPVGGHIQAGESHLHALHREAHEEIGISTFDARSIGDLIYERHVIGRHENHWFVIFEIIINPNDIVLGDEADAVMVYSPSEFKAAQRASPHQFGPSLTVVLKAFYPELLP